MIDNRDMMQYGYYQNMPGNMAYGNYGIYTPPGGLMQNMPGNMLMSGNNTNNMYDITSRLNSLESRVKALEKKVSGIDLHEDNNSMYMI